MTGKFTHYLITRFNVVQEGLGPEPFPEAPRPDSWESTRMTLFSQFCASSVSGQRNRNFVWLLFCDTDSDPALLESIATAISPEIHHRIVLVKNYKDMIMSLHDVCSQADTEFIITTRLDNDDGIGIDFIDTIQQHFVPRHNTIINLLGGIHYHQEDGLFTYLRYSAKNSFISLIESRHYPISTVMGFRHLAPGAERTIINVRKKFAFWMTLHLHNAAPRKNHGWPVMKKRVMKHYTIDPSIVRINVFRNALYFAGWLPLALQRKLGYIMRQQWQQLTEIFRRPANTKTS